MVYKSGEIIPKIKEVKKEKRPDGWKRFVIPDTCPVCGAKTEREKDTADIKCTSPNCPAQLERHIINFVGRDAMDIKGFGTVYIEELVRLGYIKDVADVFVLKTHRDELIEQGIIGKEKNTDKLLDAILPARLKTELEEIKLCLSGKADFDAYPELEKHKEWYKHLKTCSYTNVDTFMEMEVTKKFVSVLENAGVYKMDDEGMDGFSRFVKTLW